VVSCKGGRFIGINCGVFSLTRKISIRSGPKENVDQEYMAEIVLRETNEEARNSRLQRG